MSNSFNWTARVYYEDTDAGGIVYHARYLYFLERARTEWLRSLGLNQSELKALGIIFVVRDMQIKWINPACLDDLLDIKVDVELIKKASLLINQHITSDSKNKLTASVTIACLNSQTMKPIAIPKYIVTAMKTYDGQGVPCE